MIFQIIINTISLASIYILMSIGFALIYYIVRFFHFSHAIVYTLGAYFVFLSYKILSINITLSIILSLLLVALVGVLIELVVYRPLRAREATPMILLISSLGIYLVLQNVISIIFGDDTKVIRSGLIKEGFEIFNANITEIQVYTILTGFAVLLVTIIILKFTIIGKKIHAVSLNKNMAEILGINSQKVIMITFFIGSMFAGIGGLLVGFDIGIVPTMGFDALMIAVVIVIVSGIGSIGGIFLSSILLSILHNLASWFFSSDWQNTIAFFVLIIFLLIKPHGLFGKTAKKSKV